jgi:hypothetical protein
MLAKALAEAAAQPSAPAKTIFLKDIVAEKTVTSTTVAHPRRISTFGTHLAANILICPQSQLGATRGGRPACQPPLIPGTAGSEIDQQQGYADVLACAFWHHLNAHEPLEELPP